MTASPPIRRAQIQVASATWTSVDRIEAQPEPGAGDCSYWPGPRARQASTTRPSAQRLYAKSDFRSSCIGVFMAVSSSGVLRRSWPAAAIDLRAVGLRPPGPPDRLFYCRRAAVSLGFAARRHYNEAGRVEARDDVMLRLEVLCFAGTYGLALLSELARFVTRSAARWYLTVGLTALGWLVQTAYLADLSWSQHKVPVTTVFESLLVLSWIMALIGLYLMVRSPRQVAVGLFVLPLVLALVLLAGRFASRTAQWDEWRGATAFWGSVHGVFLLAGAVSTCVAFAAGLMYLVQSNRLKHKRRPRFGFSLPSLEQSERLNRGAITLAFPLLTFGLLIGVILDLAVRRRGVGGAAELDRSQGGQRQLDVAGLRGALARPVPAGDAGAERDAADDPGVCVSGLHLGGGRRAPLAHGARRAGAVAAGGGRAL